MLQNFLFNVSLKITASIFPWTPPTQWKFKRTIWRTIDLSAVVDIEVQLVLILCLCDYASKISLTLSCHLVMWSKPTFLRSMNKVWPLRLEEIQSVVVAAIACSLMWTTPCCIPWRELALWRQNYSPAEPNSCGIGIFSQITLMSSKEGMVREATYVFSSLFLDQYVIPTKDRTSYNECTTSWKMALSP